MITRRPPRAGTWNGCDLTVSPSTGHRRDEPSCRGRAPRRWRGPIHRSAHFRTRHHRSRSPSSRRRCCRSSASRRAPTRRRRADPGLAAPCRSSAAGLASARCADTATSMRRAQQQCGASQPRCALTAPLRSVLQNRASASLSVLHSAHCWALTFLDAFGCFRPARSPAMRSRRPASPTSMRCMSPTAR